VEFFHGFVQRGTHANVLRPLTREQENRAGWRARLSGGTQRLTVAQRGKRCWHVGGSHSGSMDESTTTLIESEGHIREIEFGVRLEVIGQTEHSRVERGA
jgi:hypothetical protein